MRLLRSILFPLALVALLLVPVDSARADDEPARVLFIGASGMTAADVPDSTVQMLDDFGQVGVTNLHTRTKSPSTCPIDGWMSMRVTGDAVDEAGREPSRPCRLNVDIVPEDGAVVTTSSLAPIPAKVDRFDQITRTTDWPDEPMDGVAIGIGAAVALADKDGNVEQWLPAAENPGDLQLTILSALSSTDKNVYVDVGWAIGPTGSPERLLNVEWTAQRLEAAIGAYLQYQELLALQGSNGSEGAAGQSDSSKPLPKAIDTDLIVASVGQSWDEPALQFGALVHAGDDESGLIYSPATKSEGLTTLGELRNYMSGERELRVEPMALDESMDVIRDDAAHALAARGALTPWFIAWGALVIIGILAGLIHFYRRPGPEDGPVFIWGNLALWNTIAFAWVPAAMILNFIPWWRWSTTWILPAILTLVIAIVLAMLARTSTQPIAVIAAITLALLAFDIVSAAHLQRDGFFGSMTLTSRRFYGISNRSYIILLVSGLLATLPWLADKLPEKRKDAAAGIALMGVSVLAIDALPMWGADFGGPPGIIAAFGVAALLIAGKRLKFWHALAWIALSVLAMAFAGYLDVKSGAPSHIGRFWATFGSPESWALMAGKIRDMTATFAGRPIIVVALIVALAVIVWAVWTLRKLLRGSPVHAQALRDAASVPGLPAIALGILLGVVIAIPINDSGALMAVDGVAIAGPALIAILARHLRVLRTPDTETPESAPATASASTEARDDDADAAQP